MNKNKPKPINPTMYSMSVSPLVFPTVKDVRREYARLRSTASKRLNRLASAGYENTQAYRNYSDKLKPLPRGASEAVARRALSDVAYFLSLKTSTVSGQKSARDKQLDTMRDRGYDFISEKNIDKFREYMDKVSSYVSSQQYGSEDLVDLFAEAEARNIDPLDLADDFADYLNEEGEVQTAMLDELSEEDQEALDSMESDELKEQIPVEITGPRRLPEQKRKKTGAQKRAEKIKQQASKMKQRAARRPKSRKRGR